mmetsp:Transcript_121061/g.302113  ORF Transcript_121061/g.302113 Transcript_121061/m.302113 type:complete len:262 (+) Transcript_121061:177-962(+)
MAPLRSSSALCSFFLRASATLNFFSVQPSSLAWSSISISLPFASWIASKLFRSTPSNSRKRPATRSSTRFCRSCASSHRSASRRSSAGSRKAVARRRAALTEAGSPVPAASCKADLSCSRASRWRNTPSPRATSSGSTLASTALCTALLRSEASAVPELIISLRAASACSAHRAAAPAAPSVPWARLPGGAFPSRGPSTRRRPAEVAMEIQPSARSWVTLARRALLVEISASRTTVFGSNSHMSCVSKPSPTRTCVMHFSR